ncbi:MAG: cysteine--tRNA ligase, partial [Pseudomonadota bacterium]|nr:cysteine--tRNA ligase [Pseudomonadota bacterium]
YVCGPTVYDRVHIGNGRPAVVFDVLVRLLRLYYKNVRYVRNITDIDDKINAAAQAVAEPIAEITDRFAVAYQEDVAALGVLEPTVEPRATNHIPEIIDMIKLLVQRGHAYEAEGHVLFDVPSDPDYGSLSQRSLADMIDGARIEVAPYKRDPKDFVLWKPSTEDLPGWESPWGRGRPGWHIECSAMIHKHLGATIDIHGGGNDLTFPHHENELAQGRCAGDHANYVRYWMHNGMLTMGAEKMSKSIGNIVTIRELLESHDGEVLRYALLSGQYRQSLVWEERLLQQARSSLDTLYQALRTSTSDRPNTARFYANSPASAFPGLVLEALADDLNTPMALAALHSLAGEIHSTTSEQDQSELREQLLAGGWLLGILNTPAEQYFQTDASLDNDSIQALIDERQAARNAKDFALADALRDQLLASGIELEDTAEGTRWRTL